MKVHTNEFKNAIKLYGKELDSIITYKLNDETIELGNQELNSVSPHYEGAILKSVMKQLDIDSNLEIPVGTELNYQFGVKVRDNAVEDYRDNYDYINFGNYIVYKIEKQEDVNSYVITCYDKLLYSMKDYEPMNITYPITIRDYINTVCEHLGLTFKNASDTFANYNKQIQTELYMSYNTNKQQWESLGYTFRDVLDELAQVTASTICLDENDNLEIRYITDTHDTINAEYLDSINVLFGEATKPVNTIVLSRSGGSDKVYKSYPDDLPDEEKNAIEIANNQIMNFNDRDTYLTDILNRLNGLTYCLNDFSSKGICYYNLCDRYTIDILGNTYSCVMFNDEINVTQGLEENIHTDLPQETETDYTKADKTDRRINQTYLIVDKQNQEISSVISTVGEQNTKISTISQKVDELSSQISDIADITISGESTEATFDLDNINTSEPIMIKVRPIVESISYLYPRNNLWSTTQYYPATTGLVPSNSLVPNNSLKPNTERSAQDIVYLKNRKIRFHNKTTNENIDYELPDDLLWYDSETFDEFYLDYDSQTCQIVKRCGYNADGSVYKLSNEITKTFTYPLIELTDGNYTISLLGYSNGYIFTRLMSKNIYTTQFYTKVETDSHINQKANEIELGVNQTLTNYSTTSEMNSAINLKANEISSTVSETYSTKTQTEQAKNEAISSANSSTDDKLEDYSTTTQMTSAINQKANEITSSVSETYATKTTTNTLSSRISQTAKGISLSVNNGSTSSGITIGVTKEDGTTESTSGTIQMNGLVKFTDLSTSGSTTINGSNITTGTINGNNVNVTNINAGNITAGTLTARAINNNNFRVTTGGVITAVSGTIGGWTLNSNSIYGSSTNAVRLSTTAVTKYNDSATFSYWTDIIRAGQQASDKRVKNNIKNIENKFEDFYNNLNPVTFYYNKNYGVDDKLHFGFIVQDIQENQKKNKIEDIGMIWENPDIYNLDKQEIIALNTWQIQKLKEEIKLLKEEINSLKKGK